MNESIDRILSLLPTTDNDYTINWEALKDSPLSKVFLEMEKTPQNSLHHAEGDVFTHTRLVCEALVNLDEYRSLTKKDKEIMFVAALLHDVGKTVCTKIEDGVIVSPHHAVKGAFMAREILWRDLNVCGTKEAQAFREAVCHLIQYHSFPPRAIDRENSERRLLEIASCSHLTSGFSVKKLCILEKADVLGRISKDNEVWLDNIEYCKILAKELSCLDTAFRFSSAFSKRAYFKKQTDWMHDELFDNTWGEVILLSGLPGTGKDTWIEQNCPDIPMVSLDEWRKRLKISPTDNQGQVIAAAKEEAKQYLRKKQPFVWNATNISETIRSSQISMFEDYNARVRTVFLETSWQEQLRRNAERADKVPQAIIEKLLSKLEIPKAFESQTVEWITV